MIRHSFASSFFRMDFILTGKSLNIRKIILVLISSLLFTYARSQNNQSSQDYQIIPTENSEKKVKLKLADSNALNLLLTKKKKEADTISLTLSSFVGDVTGAEVPLALAVINDSFEDKFLQVFNDTIRILPSGKYKSLSNIIVDKPILPVQLIISDLPSYQNYVGTLIISRNQEEVKSFQIEINSEPLIKADLVLDMASSTQKYTRQIFGKRQGPEFIWHISEKNRKEKIKGVYAELKEYTSSAGNFYPKRDIKFHFDTTKVNDFWGIKPGEIADRTVEIGEQAEVRAKLRSLPAGEYSAKFNFLATNAVRDDAKTQATMILKVKDHWFWAAFWLTVAIIFSFFTNKWVNTRRQKLELKQKISDLNPAWLRLEPPSLGMIRARSTLKLLDNLVRRLYLSNSELIDQKLEEVKVLIKYLDRSRMLRSKVQSMGLGEMKYRRALKNYRRISDKIGGDKIDNTIAAEIEAGFEKLELWFQPGQFDKCYGEDLQKDVDHLLNEIGEAKEFPKKCKKDFDELLDKLKKDKSGSEGEENLYATVKVLWERRFKPDVLEGLIKNYKEHGCVNLLFDEVDRLEWKNLHDIHKKKELNFVRPQLDALEYPETFQPLWFEILPKDTSDADNYLFKHGLQYKWEISIKPDKSYFEKVWQNLFGKGKERLPKLKSVTYEPKVVQFIPKKSKIDYHVAMVYHDRQKKTEPIVIREGGVEIVPSSIFTINKAFQNIELFALVASWLVAGISGLLTFYFKNDTFGQVSDYITLFLWGAGVDQTKNFIQNYQAFTKKKETGAG